MLRFFAHTIAICTAIAAAFRAFILTILIVEIGRMVLVAARRDEATAAAICSLAGVVVIVRIVRFLVNLAGLAFSTPKGEKFVEEVLILGYSWPPPEVHLTM